MSLADKVKIKKLAEQAEPTKRWGLKELYQADLPPILGALEGHVFTPQACSLIIGDFGSGKTWLALSLAAAISRGQTWGHMRTAQHDVLFLSEEMTPQELRPRLHKIFSPSDINAMDPAFVPVFRSNFKLERDEDCKRMAELITETHARFTVVDALRDIHSCEEGNNDQMSQMMRNARNLVATPTNSHVCFLHHTSKPSEFRKGAHRGRGAIVMMDVAADILVIEAGPNKKIVSFEKTRHGAAPKPFAYTISDDPEDSSKVLLEIMHGEVTSPMDEDLFEAKKIRDYILKEGPLTMAQIAKIMGREKRTVRRYCEYGQRHELFRNTAKTGTPAIFDVKESVRLEFMKEAE